VVTDKEADLIMPEKFMKPLNDIMFRKIFTGIPFIIQSFLSTLLGLPLELFDDIKLQNTMLLPDKVKGKLCIPDLIFKNPNGTIFILENQIKPQEGILKRLEFYASRVRSYCLFEAGKYITIPKIITILVADFNLFDKQDYIYDFDPYNKKNDITITDTSGLVVLQLPRALEATKPSVTLDWALFLRSKSKEEMMSVKTSDLAICQARDVVLHVSRDPQAWTTDYELEKATRDWADKLATAMDEGELRARRAVVKHMLLQKFSVEDISRITGYPVDEVARLSSDS
jgi:predicted transposase/invertase (TIGR01784 family)